MQGRFRTTIAAGVATAAACSSAPQPDSKAAYDVVIRSGMIYDGSGSAPFVGDVAMAGDRVTYVGPHADGAGKEEIDASGKAVAPGFVNMLAHPEQSILIDGRALSDLKQGVTLEVMGESSMGPITDKDRASAPSRQGDMKYPVEWSTLGGYLDHLEHRTISPNIASFVGAGTVREYVLGVQNVKPTAPELEKMKTLVHDAMEQGALGLTTALIYVPDTFSHTDELKALATESARCGGIYTAHIRDEGARIEAAVQETIDIARASGAPGHIYHIKQSGVDNWDKFEAVRAMVEGARAGGVRITADMYPYPAGATGLDASMPPWVQEGGYDAWAKRLKDPKIRARVAAEMLAPAATWENMFRSAGPDKMMILEVKNPALRPLVGKRLSEVAQARGKPPEQVAMDLVVEDGSRVMMAYFTINEDNIRKEIATPWIGYDSDYWAMAPEGVFLNSSPHPRTYGSFARVLSRYVGEQKIVPMEEAIRKLTSFATETFSIPDRGRLKQGYYADVVVFDPARIRDLATFEKPHQLAEGVEQVFVNGVRALKDGEATRLPSGRVIRGRAYRKDGAGGCRANASDWTWSK